MSDAHEARPAGEPLPVNPEAVRAAMDGIAADSARFRRRRGGAAEGGGDDAQRDGRDPEGQRGQNEPPLNWGPEGDEGPLLSIGAKLLICIFMLLTPAAIAIR